MQDWQSIWRAHDPPNLSTIYRLWIKQKFESNEESDFFSNAVGSQASNEGITYHFIKVWWLQMLFS